MYNFAFTDIHGNGMLFDKILSHIEKYDDVTVYFLGDACDRGKNGYRIIKHILNDSRFIYLKGNHEDLFVRAARELREILFEEGINKNSITSENVEDIIYNYYYASDISLHIQNGGIYTLRDWVLDGMNMNIINKLDALPSKIDFININGKEIEFTHAGHLISENEELDYLWSRDHFHEEYTKLSIHGHTNIVSMVTRYFCTKPIWLNTGEEVSRNIIISNIEQPIIYANGTKIALDVSTITSNRVFLLNLDTLTSECLKIIKN